MRRLSRVLLALSFLPAPARGETSAFAELLEAAPSSAVTALSEPSRGAPLAAAPVEERNPVEGIGVSHSGDPMDIPDLSQREVARLLKSGGGTHYRPHMPLNEPLKELSSDMLARLGEAGSDAAAMDAMIETLSREGDWSRMDELVDAFTAEGIRLILVVGAGYRKEAPLFRDKKGRLREVSPERIGRETYLAMLRLIVGAQVRRYGGRVRVWQIENEINAAFATAAFVHWRVRELSWADREYMTRVMQVLGDAVHGEGRSMGRDLKTVHNFLIGVPIAPWMKYVKAGTGNPGGGLFSPESKNYLDIVGLDSYLNYYQGVPNLDKVVGKHVAEVKKAAGGRPVWVLETGVAGAPWQRGFTEKRQAKYFRKAFDEAYKNGASMVMAFGWFWNPRGWYNDRAGKLPWWHPQAVEQYWSPVVVKKDAAGGKTVRFKKAWRELREAAERWLPGRTLSSE